jgi:hypothetical protein
MWFTLHPATKTSHFFEPVDKARPHLEGGIDKGAPHLPFSYTGAKMFSFMAIMFSFPLNPHMVQRSVPHRTSCCWPAAIAGSTNLGSRLRAHPAVAACDRQFVILVQSRIINHKLIRLLRPCPNIDSQADGG